MFFEVKKSSNKQFKSPLEKVPFATFYPRWKYLCGTYFSKKDFFKWTPKLNLNGKQTFIGIMNMSAHLGEGSTHRTRAQFIAIVL